MTYTMAAPWGDDDEPRDLHDLRCPTWTDPGPVLVPDEDCTCRSDSGYTRFQAGVDARVALFERYAADGRSA